MNPSKKNKLFDKYMAGDISQEEMHELNQYALEDDFLFEALEGAAGYETGNKNAIEELNKRFNTKRKKKRSPLFIWTSVAATIAILIIAFTFIPELENKTLSDVVMEEEVQSAPMEDQVEADFIQKSEPELASNKEELSPAPPPPPPAAVITSPEPLRSQKPKIDLVDNEELNEESNEGIAFRVQPEGEKDVKLLDKIELADAELKSTDNAQLEIKRREINPTHVGASNEKAKQSAPSPVSSLPRKKRESSRNTFLDQSVSAGVEAESDDSFAKPSPILISFDNEEIGVLFQEFAIQNFDAEGFSDFVLLEMIVNEKQEASNIEIKSSLNPSKTRKIKDLVESFKEWGEVGNKTLRITFTKL